LRGPHLSWGLSLIILWTVPMLAPLLCTPAITGEECEWCSPKLQLGKTIHLPHGQKWRG
jgi:hypothetical protein